MNERDTAPTRDEIVEALLAPIRECLLKAHDAGRVVGREDALREIAAALNAATPEAHYRAEERQSVSPVSKPQSGREFATIPERAVAAMKPGEVIRVPVLAKRIRVRPGSLHAAIATAYREGAPILKRVGRGQYSLAQPNGATHAP